jgi:quaternary ammonium compound-resistance protein SugE
VSFLLLSFAMRKLPMGTAYAVWTGIGVVGTFIFGAFVLREPMGIAQGVCVLLILLGIIGLKVLS